MAIAYLYFEWRTVYECIKRCHQRGCRRSQARQIGFLEDANEHQKYDEGEGSLNNDSGEDGIDERLNNNIERLVHKNKKDTSYNEP